MIAAGVFTSLPYLMQVLFLSTHTLPAEQQSCTPVTLFIVLFWDKCATPPSIHRYIVSWFPVVDSTKWTSNKDTAMSKGREIKIVKDKVGTSPGQEWTMDAFYKQRQDGCKQRSQVHFLSCLIFTPIKPESQKTEMNTHWVSSLSEDWGQGPSALVIFLIWCCF